MRNIILASLLAIAAGCAARQSPDRGFVSRATNRPQPAHVQQQLERPQQEQVTHGY